MKKLVIFFVYIFCINAYTFSQAVGVGTASPNGSAILDVSSSTKGMLLPRMSTSQRNAIVNPVIGLMILNTDDLCSDIFDGSKWIKNCGLKQGDSTTVSANNWVQKPSFGGIGRLNAVGFSIGTKGYVGTGDDGSYVRPDFWEFDSTLNAWTQKADFGGPARTAAAGFSIGTKGYVGTGILTSAYNDFWEYNPATNTWLQKANFTGGARYYSTGFSIGSKGYMGTGNNGTPTSDFWEYDPTSNAWIQKASFPANSRENSTSFSIGSKGYLGFGQNGLLTLQDFFEYDPGIPGSLGSWTSKAVINPIGRYGAVGFSIGNKGYVGTGYENSSLKKNDFWEYDPSTNLWTQKANLPGESRNNAVGFSIGSRGYICTGSGTSNLNDFWEYNQQAYSVASYSTASGTLSQSNISDGIWSKSVLGLIKSSGGAVTITPTGNVGIGLPAPINKLEVGGNIRAGVTYQAMLGTHPSYNQSLVGLWLNPFGYFVNTDGYSTYLQGGISSGDIYLKTNNLNRVFVGLSGNVGIGTIIPAQKLDVSGTIHALNLNGGATTLSTDASGNIIRTPSDARLKKNIIPIDNALYKVLQLQGHTYNFKDEKRFGRNRQMGFLAQELEVVVPEAVSSGGEYKSVNYPVLTALLAESIKEQQKQIETLRQNLIEKEQQLQQQKTDIIELKNQVQAILSKIDVK